MMTTIQQLFPNTILPSLQHLDIFECLVKWLMATPSQDNRGGRANRQSDERSPLLQRGESYASEVESEVLYSPDIL